MRRPGNDSSSVKSPRQLEHVILSQFSEAAAGAQPTLNAYFLIFYQNFRQRYISRSFQPAEILVLFRNPVKYHSPFLSKSIS
jgi:hypothetical protein